MLLRCICFWPIPSLSLLCERNWSLPVIFRGSFNPLFYLQSSRVKEKILRPRKNCRSNKHPTWRPRAPNSRGREPISKGCPRKRMKANVKWIDCHLVSWSTGSTTYWVILFIQIKRIYWLKKAKSTFKTLRSFLGVIRSSMTARTLVLPSYIRDHT